MKNIKYLNEKKYQLLKLLETYYYVTFVSIGQMKVSNPFSNKENILVYS